MPAVFAIMLKVNAFLSYKDNIYQVELTRKIWKENRYY